MMKSKRKSHQTKLLKAKPILPLVFALMVTSSPQVLGLGLVNKTNQGTLNRPLHIELDLLSQALDKHDLKVSLANTLQHQKIGLNYPTELPKLNFKVTQTSTGPQLIIRSIKPIKEPVVNFLLAVEYKGMSIYKEIVLLMEPPSPAQTYSNYSGLSGYSSKSSSSSNSKTSNKRLTTIEIKQPTKDSLLSGHSVVVERGQSLWQIAKSWQQTQLNLNQRMQSIFLANPKAFINADKNRLMQGATLLMPFTPIALLSEHTKPKLVAMSQKKQLSANNLSQTIQGEPAIQAKQLQQQITQLNQTLLAQEKVNAELKASLALITQSLEQSQAIKLMAQNSSKSLTPLIKNLDEGAPKATTVSTANLPSLATSKLNQTNQSSDNKFNNSSNQFNNNLSTPWLAAIWLVIALIITYLGSIFSSQRKAKRFSKGLDEKLAYIAYNENRQQTKTPSVKELSIPKHLSSTMQVKYLNAAANFYISCHRFDLAKELVNEGLIEFKGNKEIVHALNQIRKQTFNQLDNDLHLHIAEKLDGQQAFPNTPEMGVEEQVVDLEEFNRQWEKKVS
jgi:hypothetical protein